MLAIVNSIALQGLEGVIVKVEVDVSNGLPGLDLVGLPDAAVRESKERVRAAIKNSGFEFPVKRITVNLAPADIRKEGPVYDLPIAIGILAASEQIDVNKCIEYIFMGELSLDGAIRLVNGSLPAALAAKEQSYTKMVVPASNAGEAALVQGVEVFPASDLTQLVSDLKNRDEMKPQQVDVNKLLSDSAKPIQDFADVKGQLAAKRALEIAAAGGHNVFMIGTPGSGKTMLARRLPGILPDLTFEEAVEATKVHSLAGQLQPNQALITRRPFRSPHHSASAASLIGGGRIPRPGEVSLAHHGVLFMDEILEFRKDVLESLRQPLEDGIVSITRVQSSLTYPARIMLVASANPCPCGYYGDKTKECSCTPNQIQRYLRRLSGPLLDRIDMHIEISRVEFNELENDKPGESSASIKERVENARYIQRQRFSNNIAVACNAQMPASLVRKHCNASQEARSLLRSAFKQLNLSARSHDKILKVARTIADLAGKFKTIEAQHMAEALQYRNLESELFG
ncbi:MAG: YifB family Mg chelatase-like AAA ATPase [Firmicutes bacterium]|nr:YifB family Mg chelatase-like AAA ATPase [Bacillota bacterium]